MRHSESVPIADGHFPTMMLLVFTDLDGTLLDHHSYSWAPARPALASLHERGDAVMLVSSKTLAEISTFRRELGLPHPVVAENGAVIDVPDGYFAGADLPVVVSQFRATLQQHYLEEKTRCLRTPHIVPANSTPQNQSNRAAKKKNNPNNKINQCKEGNAVSSAQRQLKTSE